MITARCTTCGAHIVFVPTKAGKEMPCEVKAVMFNELQVGLRYAVKIPGKGCEIKSGASILDADEPYTNASFFEPHWGNCNAPDAHRKARR